MTTELGIPSPAEGNTPKLRPLVFVVIYEMELGVITRSHDEPEPVVLKGQH